MYVTRAILPTLRSSGLPTLVVAIGSEAATSAPPSLSLYAASKAFLGKWLEGLDVDERFFNKKSDMTVHFMRSAEFSSASNPQPISFICPTAATMAKRVIGCVGCGRRVVVPYIGHGLGAGFLSLLGEKIAATLVAEYMRKKYFSGKKD